MTFFDVRIFDPSARNHESKSLQQCYKTNEKEKKRKYNELFRKLKMEVYSVSFFI